MVTSLCHFSGQNMFLWWGENNFLKGRHFCRSDEIVFRSVTAVRNSIFLVTHRPYSQIACISLFKSLILQKRKKKTSSSFLIRSQVIELRGAGTYVSNGCRHSFPSLLFAFLFHCQVTTSAFLFSYAELFMSEGLLPSPCAEWQAHWGQETKEKHTTMKMKQSVQRSPPNEAMFRHCVAFQRKDQRYRSVASLLLRKRLVSCCPAILFGRRSTLWKKTMLLVARSSETNTNTNPPKDIFVKDLLKWLVSDVFVLFVPLTRAHRKVRLIYFFSARWLDEKCSYIVHRGEDTQPRFFSRLVAFTLRHKVDFP